MHAVVLVYFTARVPLDYIVRKQVTFGITFFIAGEIMNHYHHRILAGLRKHKDDVRYKVYFYTFMSDVSMFSRMILGT